MLLFASPQIRAGILRIEFGSCHEVCNFVEYTQGTKRATATPTLLDRYFGVGERLIPSKRITPMHSRMSLNFVIDRIT
ncbi:hypothetical protein KBB41_03600 [Candidatus Curtissbacteria bacterium]|nr:hypothetical protein [Candidatus Curtissbacteria bacterium]